MTAWYNEIDPYAAQWLRNLIAAGNIAPGDVDERDIRDVQSADLTGYAQCHFFAGIGGWSHALRLAGWPDDRPVWTGSCPCQALSSATHGRATAPDLWSEWRRLIAAKRPGTIFGEQVADSRWIDRVCDDLDPLGYEIGAAVLPAVSVGKDHARQRIYFVCHTYGHGEPSVPIHEMAGLYWHQDQSGDLVQPHGVSARMERLRAFGNAIVPQVAAAFVGSFMECRP